MTVVNTVPPSVSGTVQVGRVLTTTTGTWTYDLDRVDYTYQWLRCDADGDNCDDIPGAVNPTYLIQAADVGFTLRSEVSAVETDDPEPEPPEPYDYRFATFHPTNDKIGGTLNRFNYPSNAYWWVPGQAEPPSLSGASNWSDGGGIDEITHGTYGPGFEIKVSPQMVYQGAGDSRVGRFQIDPDQPDKFPVAIPMLGATHEWRWTWRRPSGQSWPSGTLLEGMFYGTTISGSGSVGSHFYLDNNWQQAGPFHYYAARQQSFTPPTGGSGNWVRYHCPIAFNENDYHSIRWVIKLSTGSSGIMQAYTAVNGGSETQWLNYSGPTVPAGFQGVYSIAQDIRLPLSGGTNILEWYNHRLNIS